MTIGRRNGASTPSIVAMKPSWRANHQTHRRIPLETAIGASRTAANATMTITRTMRKIRFLNRIAVSQRGDERKAAIIGDYICVCHSDTDLVGSPLSTLLLVFEDQTQRLLRKNPLFELLPQILL